MVGNLAGYVDTGNERGLEMYEWPVCLEWEKRTEQRQASGKS